MRLIIALFAMILISCPAFSKDLQNNNHNNEFECLAQNIYYEAGSENYGTKIAVAYVTLNRLYSHQFSNTLCGVVYQDCQFTWHCEGNKVLPHGSNWTESIQAAVCVINNCIPNYIPDTFYFHDLRVKYAFTHKEVSITLRTDKLVFYKYNHK